MLKSCVVTNTSITLTGVKTIDGISTTDQGYALKIKQRLQKMVFIFVRVVG